MNREAIIYRVYGRYSILTGWDWSSCVDHRLTGQFCVVSWVGQLILDVERERWRVICQGGRRHVEWHIFSEIFWVVFWYLRRQYLLREYFTWFIRILSVWLVFWLLWNNLGIDRPVGMYFGICVFVISLANLVGIGVSQLSSYDPYLRVRILSCESFWRYSEARRLYGETVD